VSASFLRTKVAADAKIGRLTEAADPVLTLSLAQSRANTSFILVRTTVPPASVAPAVRSVVAALDPAVAVIGPRTLEEATRVALWAAESGVKALSMFGLLALLLSVAGLHGVVTYSVTRRVREIGIRMAIGAHAAGVASMVVRRGLLLVLIGLAIGTPLSLALSGILGRLVHGVSSTDPLTYAVIGSLIIAVLTTGVVRLNVQAFWQFIVVGVVVIVAVLIDQSRDLIIGRDKGAPAT